MKSVEAQSIRGSQVNLTVSKHRKRDVPSPGKVILMSAGGEQYTDVNMWK